MIMAWPQTLLASVVFPFILWRIYRWWMMTTFRRWKIPGPEPHLIHGNVKEIRKRGLPQCHLDWTKKYGKIFGYYIGGSPIMVISDTELLKQILKEDFNNFGNRPISTSGFMVNVGMESKQLIFTQNEQWKLQRTMWKSFFNPTNIKQLMPAMNNVIDTFLQRLSKSAITFDIYELFQELTVDIMGRLMLGLDTDSLSGKTHPLITTFRGFLKKDSGRKFPVSLACFPEFEPLLLPVLKALQSIRKLTGMSPIHDFIQQCSQHINVRKNLNNKNAPNDLLQIMLAAETPESTVIADCFSLLFGGYETTSITLAYAVDILSKNQKQQDKVRAEILDTKNSSVKALTEPAILGDTGFLGQVIEEVLRCYNPVPGFIRRRSSRTVRYGSFVIPKGTVIQVPMSCLHKDPDLWSDPEQFKPERFSSENRCSMSSLAHVPFGYGRRNCVAMQFAQTMIKLVLTRLLAEYRIFPAEGVYQDEIPVVYSIIRVVPSKGVYVKAVKL